MIKPAEESITMGFDSPVLQKRLNYTEVIIMTKKELVILLDKQGWCKYQGNNVERWQKGDALISIFKNPHGNYLLSNSTGDVKPLSDLKTISFTPFRVLVSWSGYSEWYMIY